MLEFAVLGPLTINRDGVPVAVPATLRRLCAVLLAAGGRPVPTEVLVDALWPDEPPPEPRKVLQVYVYRLRRALGAAVVVRDGDGYALPAPVTDAARFTELVERAEADEEHALSLLHRALALWRGTPYAGTPAGPVVAREAERLRQRSLIARERVLELQLADRRHAEVIAGAHELIAAAPFREEARALLMLALYRSGRRAEALEVFRDTRSLLVRQVGIEPGQRLRRLHEEMVVGDLPALVPSQVPPGVRGFVGRTEELARLDGLLDGAAGYVPIAVVTGAAGVGKSALAVRWAHRARRRFPDGQLYVDLGGFASPRTVESALRAVLGALGVPPQEDLAAQYRSAMAGRRMLVVLDDAVHAAQVRPLLPGVAGCAVLVTSRHWLSELAVEYDAEVLRLPVLAAAESRALLCGRVPALAAARADALADRCGHLPLALAVTAARLAESLDAVTDPFDELDGHSLRTALSWSYSRLSAEAAHLFLRLGARSIAPFTPHVAAARADVPVHRAHFLVAELARVNLVAETEPGWFTMHPLVREYAAELATVSRPAALLDLFGR